MILFYCSSCFSLAIKVLAVFQYLCVKKRERCMLGLKRNCFLPFLRQRIHIKYCKTRLIYIIFNGQKYLKILFLFLLVFILFYIILL